MSGIERIAAERKRQIEKEGFDDRHDDRYGNTELPSSAACYALYVVATAHEPLPEDATPDYWPWDMRWWKPSADPIRNLEKAGALIAAEIDRLERIRGEQEIGDE